MQGRITNYIRITMTYFIIILLTLISYSASYAAHSRKSGKKAATTSVSHKKCKRKCKGKKSCRTYNPSVTRSQALEILQTNSKDLCDLAGIQSKVGEKDSATVQLIKEQAEDDLDQVLPESTDEVAQDGEDIEELEREDDVAVDIEQFKVLWLSYVEDDVVETTDGGFIKKDIMDVLLDWLGTPYYFGGTSASGIDCSAFTRMVYEMVGGGLLPRSAATQFEVGKKIKRNDLQFGDLIFFNTRKKVFVSHVGIYLGDNLFAHSSSRYGVTISSLESTYYSNRFLGGRRISTNDLASKNPTFRNRTQSKLYSQKP